MGNTGARTRGADAMASSRNKEALVPIQIHNKSVSKQQEDELNCFQNKLLEKAQFIRASSAGRSGESTVRRIRLFRNSNNRSNGPLENAESQAVPKILSLRWPGRSTQTLEDDDTALWGENTLESTIRCESESIALQQLQSGVRQRRLTALPFGRRRRYSVDVSALEGAQETLDDQQAHSNVLLPRRSTWPKVQGSVCFQLSTHAHPELGYLRFECSTLEEAKTYAVVRMQPIFVVLALIPGDVHTGREAFSHPLIVEAASSLFVAVRPLPVRALDLRDPSSSQYCKSNCTQVRFLDPVSMEDLVPRLNADQVTRAGLVQAMTTALHIFYEKGRSPEETYCLPRYLEILLEEEQSLSASQSPKFAVLGTKDPTQAEVELAGLEGVFKTAVGCFRQDQRPKQRIVHVTYDPSRVSYGALLRYALHRQVAQVLYYQTNEERMAAHVVIERGRALTYCQVQPLSTGTLHQDFDPKHWTRKTPARFVPLTSLQACQVNRLIHFGRFNEAIHLMSPLQGLIMMRAIQTAACPKQNEWHEVVDVPILLAWLSVCEKQHPKHILERHPELRNPCLDPWVNKESIDETTYYDEEEEENEEWRKRKQDPRPPRCTMETTRCEL